MSELSEAPVIRAGGLTAAPPPALGTVIAVAEGSVELRLRSGSRVTAGLAVREWEPTLGERVLAIEDEVGDRWVIAVTEVGPSTPLLDAVLEEETVRRVHDRRGALLFEYDPRSDRAVLHAPTGDLELEVPAGALRMRARDGVVIDSESDVAITGRRTVTVRAETEAASSSVRLQPGALSLVGGVVTAAADRAELLAHTASVRARDLESHSKRLRTVAEVVETRAGRILERARDAYREVERLSQTRAGKLRMVAKGAAQLVGENTLLKARDRMKVRGERIHLA